VPAIVLYKQGKNYNFRISDEITARSIVEWVNENSHLFMVLDLLQYSHFDDSNVIDNRTLLEFKTYKN